MSSHEHINIESAAESSQAKGKDKQTKDFLKTQSQRKFEQAMTQVDSIEMKTNKSPTMSKLMDGGRRALHREVGKRSTNRVNDQIDELSTTLRRVSAKYR